MNISEITAQRLQFPPPLRGNQPGSFAEDTLSRRLPNIARRLMDEPWQPATRSKLQALANDMPSGRLRLLEDPGAPDLSNWQADLQPYLGETWLAAPWFVAEVYFFRRILEATGYFQPGVGLGVDPFHSQKMNGIADITAGLEQTLISLEDRTGSLQGKLSQLIREVVWGNQADLSVWPSGGPAERDQSSSQMLVDDSPIAAGAILNFPDGLGRMDFILDNSGLELAFDLVFADFLLCRDLAYQIILHAKPFPTYVSDATIPDIHMLVEHLTRATESIVRELGGRLQGFLEEGRLRLQSELFWTSPLPGWEMPVELRSELIGSNLLISKGDANYRRWLGDRHWPLTTPIERILSYRPAPMLMLRVMKAEVVAGLKPGQAEKLSEADPSWMFNGRSGLVQFVA